MVDHIKPITQGGSDATVNLQALKTAVNREKSGSLQCLLFFSKSNQ